MKVPVFNPKYRVEIIETESVYLLAETEMQVLGQAIYRSLALLINGVRTEQEIVSALEAQYALPTLYQAIYELQKRGFIIENNLEIPAAVTTFWQTLVSVSNEQTQRAVSVSAVKTLPGWIAESLVASLSAVGIVISDDASVKVVLADDYRNAELGSINQQMLQTSNSWLLIRPVGQTLTIGPWFVPGETGCWQCLVQRLNLHRPMENFLQTALGAAEPIYAPILPIQGSVQMAVHLATVEIAKWLNNNRDLAGEIFSFDLTTLKTRRHTLTRRPQCPACGNPTPKFPDPIILNRSVEIAAEDNGYHSQDPAALIHIYQRHISPLTGILPDIVSEGAENFHVYRSGRNYARLYGEVDITLRSLRGLSSGKGSKADQGKASALAEAIERYSGTYEGSEYTRLASYRDLGEDAIHPNACMLYSEQQYKHPIALPNYRRVPQPFDENAVIAWSPLWSLTHQKFKWLPTAYCYYANNALGKGYLYGDSNGAAAGATLEEAVLQGFFELVERDAVAIWWYNCLQMPGVDLASFQNPRIEEIQALCQAQGREIWALDVTSDLDIPTFAVLSRVTAGKADYLGLGFGSHTNPQIGLIRALNEMLQMIAMIPVYNLEKVRVLIPEIEDVVIFLNASCSDHPYLLPAPDKPLKRLADYSSESTANILDNLRQCQAMVENLGMEMLVLDQTRPDIDLPVVKVVVPGLRHFWARFAPGRLYDVPVKLGWLSTPTEEQNLNSFPMIL